jgi:hypothetical protein
MARACEYSFVKYEDILKKPLYFQGFENLASSN